MKKLKYTLVRRKLQEIGLPIFTVTDLQQIFQVEKRSAQAFLSYHKRLNNLIKLKNRYYCLEDKKPHDFLIANKIYFPSYISLETALSYHQIIPETVYSITSITTKKTQRFLVLGKEFVYRSLKTDGFSGYKLYQIDDKTRAYIALPEKALADYLYYCFLENREVNERIKREKIKESRLLEYLKILSGTKLVKFWQTRK